MEDTRTWLLRAQQLESLKVGEGLSYGEGWLVERLGGETARYRLEGPESAAIDRPTRRPTHEENARLPGP